MTVDERESEIGALLEASRQLEQVAPGQAAELYRRALSLAALRGRGGWRAGDSEGMPAAA